MPRPRRFPGLPLVLSLLFAGAAGAQVPDIRLVERGRAVPLSVTGEEAAAGRVVARGLLAMAHEDVTRPVTDAELAGLGRRGTLLHVRLDRAEEVVLLRLGTRTRASRIAAYVPPGRDDRAYVFLGRERWSRIVVVDLPRSLQSSLRRLRGTRP